MYYFKESILVLFYELVMSSVSIVVMNIEITWLKLALCCASIVLFIYILIAYFLQLGQKAFKKLNENDLKRKKIVETGEDIFIDSKPEYKAWKGFVIGAFAFIPMLILLLVYAIVLICGGTSTTLIVINNFVYLVFSAPIMTLSATPQGAICFVVLYGALLTSIASGISYIFGAKKVQRQYEIIKEKQKYLHGEE